MGRKKTKEELTKDIMQLYQELNYTEGVVRDLINTIFMIVETQSKRNLITGKRRIDTDLLLKEISRINLSKEVKHPSLRRRYI